MTKHTSAVRRQWPHIEDVDALHLSEDFQALKASGLLEIRGDRAGFCSGGNQVFHRLDLYTHESDPAHLFPYLLFNQKR
jgi:hypothetical protein